MTFQYYLALALASRPEMEKAPMGKVWRGPFPYGAELELAN